VNRLGCIAEVCAGQAAPQDPSSFGTTGAPFIRAGSLARLCAGESPRLLEQISPDVAQKYRLRLFPANTILFAKSGMSAKIGRIYKLLEPAYVVSHLAAVIPKSGVAPGYLAHFFVKNSPSRLIPNEAYPSIRLSEIEDLNVPLPSIDEQRRIATILDKIKAIRVKRQKTIQLVDKLIKSRFVEMFGDPMTNPKGWEVKRLSDLFRVRSSKRVYQREQTDHGIPFLRISDLVNKITHGVDICDSYISEELYASFEKDELVPKANDILVTSRGTLGLCYIIHDEDRFYFQDGMISWLNKQSCQVNSVYIAFLFTTDAIKQKIEQSSSGSTVNYLSLANLENFDVMLPPISLQNCFADFVKQADKSKFAMKKSLYESEMMHKSLMQEYFG